MFEKASRLKLRFEWRGVISVEDLWDVGLIHLDEMYRKLAAEARLRVQDSLLEENKGDDILQLKIDLIKHVVAVKLDEREAKKIAAEKLDKKRRIKEILAEKQDEGLKEMSEEKLLKMLEEL